jgi:hypothetical protein
MAGIGSLDFRTFLIVPLCAIAVFTTTVTSAQDMVVMSLDSSNAVPARDEVFSVAVVVQAGSQEVDGMEVYLGFDPARLRPITVDGQTATTIEPGESLDLILANQIDATEGVIHFAAGKIFAPLPSGTFVIARITATALSPFTIGDVPVWVLLDPDRESLATLNGDKLPLVPAGSS